MEGLSEMWVVGQTDNRTREHHDRDPLDTWYAARVVASAFEEHVERRSGDDHRTATNAAATGARLLSARLARPHWPRRPARLSLWGEHTLAFTFAGLVIGSVLSALPVVVQPIRNVFATMGDRPLEIAATLRASQSYAFLTVALPLA